MSDLPRTTTALALVRPRDRQPDVPRLLRGAQRFGELATPLEGPGAAAVRSAARALVLAIELYEQRRRRLAAEVHREEAAP